MPEDLPIEMPRDRLEDRTDLMPLLYSSFSMTFCVLEGCSTAMPFLASIGGRWLVCMNDNYIQSVNKQSRSHQISKGGREGIEKIVSL
jgi:hypothetical protein